MTRPLSAGAPLSGQPLSRVDGSLKVTGRARYAADHPIPAHLHGILVTSTIARGTIDRIDTAAATQHPDVHRVITDFTGLALPYDISRVSFFGQPVAVVVAGTHEAAVHGAQLVTVTYREEPQQNDFDAPTADRRPSDDSPDYARGDADGALRAAPVTVEGTYRIARNYHNPMEIPSTIAEWDGDRLTVWDKVQGVHYSRDAYSAALGVPAQNIRVISPFVGGAFGSAGETWPHQFLAAHTARVLGRPVKLTLTRPQMYAAIGYRPASAQRVSIGARTDGRITAIVHESTVEVSRYGSYQEAPAQGTQFLYSSPAVTTAAQVVALDVSEPTYMRGPGAVTGAFALECALDTLAVRLGLDPVELRLRNEPRVDESTGLPFSTRRIADCFREGADAFGWSRRNPTPRSMRDGDELVGIGTAAALYHVVRNESSASARINADGTVEVFAATSDIGPGTYTSMTQVAADALGMPLHRVRFALGDTRFPRAAVQYGSQTMLSVGSSIHLTANMLRDKAVRTAILDPGSPLNGARPADVIVTDGRMHLRGTPQRGETYQDLLRRKGLPSLDSEQTYTPDDADDRYSMHSYGAVFAEVGVDELLGTIRVRRLYAVYDAGRVINPKLAHSQALSGMTQGIGMALLENAETDLRDGRIVNANLSDYLVPVNADVPALDAHFLTARDDIAGPIGVKGLGEVVMVGVPAAIANAVYHATGKRITDLPITIADML